MKPILIFIVVLTFYLVLFEKANAQLKSFPSNFPSPNASGNINNNGIQPNLFTGALNMEVPIYKIVEGNIVLPISLNYNSSEVKSTTHPGLMGLGWNLNASGSIIRVRNYVKDEHRQAKYQSDDGPKMGFYNNYTKLDTPDWYTVSRLKEYERGRTAPVAFEVTADEFIFNFLGYSGKFYMNEKGKWVVVSESAIKVEFNPNEGFINNEELVARIGDKADQNNKLLSNRYFDKFTLITPDGIRCEFGGVNATEYSTSYRRQIMFDITSTSFFLTKISSRGKTIEFNYMRGPNICAISHEYNYIKMSRNDKKYIDLNNCKLESGALKIKPSNGFLIFPVYLTSINTGNLRVDFENSPSQQLKYRDLLIKYDNVVDKVLGELKNFYIYFEHTDSLKWLKLDRIKIKYANSELLKEYEFNYTNSLDDRLKLLSIQEKDKNGTGKPAHKFSYYPSTFPHYCSDKVDHWGYNTVERNYEYESVQDAINVYTAAREPDTVGNELKSELLSRIDYSDGGFTELEYEPNTYSKVVNLNRTSLTSFTRSQFTGGSRIKKISTYPNNDAAPMVKEFFYESNYSGQLDRSGLISSGVLGGKVQYYWPDFKSKDAWGVSYTYDVFSSGTVLPFGLNSQGSHIGYTEVIEFTPNNGYIKRTFTNFDTGTGSQSNMDEAAVNWIDENRSVFSPYTSKADERGKLARLEIFNRYNQKIKETSYTYGRVSNSYLRCVQFETLGLCASNTSAIFGTAYKIYIDPPLLTSEVDKIYSTNDPGNEAKVITTSKTFEYNSNKLLKKSIVDQGDGQTIVTVNKYPVDYDIPSNIPLTEMKSPEKHIINSIVEQIVYKNHNLKSTILSGSINIYGPNYLPESTYILYGQTTLSSLELPMPYRDIFNGLPYLKKSTLSYDDYGNIIEIKDANHPSVTYLFSYKSSKPVAKIINASKEEVATALGYTNYKTMAQSYAQNFTEALKAKLDSLRTLLPNSRVTTYTHNPIIGITSTTDENGKTTYCEYDSFTRVQLIKDNDSNILKVYRYNSKVK